MNIMSDVSHVFQQGQTTVGTTKTTMTTMIATRGIQVKAHPDNTGTVYIGRSDLTAGNGYFLMAGEDVFLPYHVCDDVYILGSDADQVVCWMVF